MPSRQHPFAPKWLQCAGCVLGVSVLPTVVCAAVLGNRGLAVSVCLLPATGVFFVSFVTLIDGHPPNFKTILCLFDKLLVGRRSGWSRQSPDDGQNNK